MPQAFSGVFENDDVPLTLECPEREKPLHCGFSWTRAINLNPFLA
jgi:hypothetical protein